MKEWDLYEFKVLKAGFSLAIELHVVVIIVWVVKENRSCMGSLKDVCANCFCASLLRTAARANSHATSCIKRARQVLKWTMIGQMAIAIALLGFNDLGRSVTPTFLFRNRFWEVKKISRFMSTGHGILPSCGCKVRETRVSKCELILWGTSPID